MSKRELEFRIAYDGESLSDGMIDARDLAPALIAMADMVDCGIGIVEPSSSMVTVRVKSDFRKGSFDVGLELAQTYDGFISLFSGNHVQAWATLLSLLGISGGGLLQLLKRAKGRKPRVIEIERSEKLRIVFDEGDGEEIDKRIWWMFNHPILRIAIEKLVEPLSRDGIEIFYIKKGDQKTLEVSKQEVSFFRAPQENEGERIFENPDALLVVVSPSFRDGNKWRLHDGTKAIWAVMSDTVFMERVNSGSEAFRKGDLLRVTLQTRQWIEGKEPKAEYRILKVHEHDNNLGQTDFSDLE